MAAVKRVSSKTATRAAAPAAERSARIRMYRHGLGDCFLVRFPKKGGGSFNILIDCGLISVAAQPKVTMDRVAKDIQAQTGNHIDVAVMTHEHWDHVSGFSTQQVQDAFAKMDVDEAWYAWTEDPKNALGNKLRRERAAKVRALERAALALRARGTPLAVRGADRVESILQFFGVAGAADLTADANSSGGAIGKTRAAFEYLANRRGVKTRYCYPDRAPLDLAGVDGGVRVYFLGPPQDEGLIKRSSPTKKGAEVYEFVADMALDSNLATAFERMLDNQAGAARTDCPFEASVGFRPGVDAPPRLQYMYDNVWNGPDMAWRQIEEDWTSVAETLALNLDTHTNNTCLVVAFELVETGDVLLFAADAQVGNWLSWQSTTWSVKGLDGSKGQVTGPDLLNRTVFYKVGHHGSHNATLRAQGLEQMTSENLTAFVPVFKEHAEKNRWHAMPFAPLVKRLKERTGGRLVFSDPKVPAPTLENLPAKARQAFEQKLLIDALYYEYSIPY